jgi:hypothetical protein
MGIWDFIVEILFSRAHEETNTVSALPDISRLASIAADDERETRDRSTVSARFVATGIGGFTDVLGMQCFTPHTDGNASDNPFVEVGFIGVTGRDLQYQWDPTSENWTETAGDQIERARKKFLRRRVLLVAVKRPTSRFSAKRPHVLLSGFFCAFILLPSTGVCHFSHPTICKARRGGLPRQSIFPQGGQSIYTGYNGNRTPSALDCRVTSSSVSTSDLMPARFCHSCFGVCLVRSRGEIHIRWRVKREEGRRGSSLCEL